MADDDNDVKSRNDMLDMPHVVRSGSLPVEAKVENLRWHWIALIIAMLCLTAMAITKTFSEIVMAVIFGSTFSQIIGGIMGSKGVISENVLQSLLGKR